MRSQEAAFDEAYASLNRLGLPGALPELHAAGISISRAVLGGSHSVAIYPPINSLRPMDPAGLVDAIGWGSDTSLYIHVAFCETRCTFCHYAVDHYAGRAKSSPAQESRVSRYLTALKRELAFWGARLASSGTAVSSIYIGGGTPLVLDDAALGELLGTIRDEYRVLPGSEICIEGSPLTITAADGADKLRFLEANGVTRLSFGVQSFDDTVLKYAARGYKRDVAIQACAIADEVFENWNLDLIQGLYKGSPVETWHNLVTVAGIRPPHLTWYHGRFADRPQGHWYGTESKRTSFEDEFETLVGRMLIWQELTLLGYQLTDGNRFVREDWYTDPFKKIRTSATSNLLGVGAASYSHVGARTPDRQARGYVFRNQPNIGTYLDAVLAGDLPITTGRVIDQEELFAMSYATGLRNGRIEDPELRTDCAELARHYDSLVRELSDVGVLTSYLDDGRAGLRLSELGRLFEDETLALFFSPAVKSALADRVPAGLVLHKA